MNQNSISGIPPILENRILITNVVAKTNILDNYSVQQCFEISTGTIYLVLFLDKINVYQVYISRCKVLPLVRSLDPKKAGG